MALRLVPYDALAAWTDDLLCPVARNDSCTPMRSSFIALKRFASEPVTRMKTEPPTLVAEISARRSTVFAL